MSRFLSANGAHRRLEGWPLVFTVLTTIAVAIGGVCWSVDHFLSPDCLQKKEIVFVLS